MRPVRVRVCLFECENEATPLPTHPSPPLPHPFQINALCRLLVADSYQWAISIQASLTVCLRPAMWPAMSYGAPSCSVIPQSPSVCSRLPYTHTHTHTDRQRHKPPYPPPLRNNTCFLSPSPRLVRTQASPQSTQMRFHFRVGSLRLCVRERARACVFCACVRVVHPKQLPAPFLLRVCISCGSERLFGRWSGSPIGFSTLPVSDVYMQSLIQLCSKFGFLV